MKIVFTFISMIFLTSCPTDIDYKTDCEVNTPIEELAWLEEIKIGFEQSTSISKKKIIQYEYNNATVFLIDSCNTCADNLTLLYNCEGIEICKFGGIAGFNTCADFEKNAINKIVIWEN